MAKCKNCKHMIYQKVVFNYTTTEYPYCPAFEECLDDIDKEIVCSGFEGITNADRIRSMTDEELVKLLIGSCSESMGMEHCPHDDEFLSAKYLKNSCSNCVMEWLKSEVGCE